MRSTLPVWDDLIHHRKVLHAKHFISILFSSLCVEIFYSDSTTLFSSKFKHQKTAFWLCDVSLLQHRLRFWSCVRLWARAWFWQFECVIESVLFFHMNENKTSAKKNRITLRYDINDSHTPQWKKKENRRKGKAAFVLLGIFFMMKNSYSSPINMCSMFDISAMMTQRREACRFYFWDAQFMPKLCIANANRHYVLRHICAMREKNMTREIIILWRWFSGACLASSCRRTSKHVHPPFIRIAWAVSTHHCLQQFNLIFNALLVISGSSSRRALHHNAISFFFPFLVCSSHCIFFFVHLYLGRINLIVTLYSPVRV